MFFYVYLGCGFYFETEVPEGRLITYAVSLLHLHHLLLKTLQFKPE